MKYLTTMPFHSDFPTHALPIAWPLEADSQSRGTLQQSLLGQKYLMKEIPEVS